MFQVVSNKNGHSSMAHDAEKSITQKYLAAIFINLPYRLKKLLLGNDVDAAE
jgi:hypothetical protein